MPRKKSVRLCASRFRQDSDKLLEFCAAAEKGMSAAHVSLVYDAAIIKLYANFERLMIGALIGAINNDTSQLHSTTRVQFPKNLTDEVCEYIIVGNGYFNFKGRDGLIREIKKYVPDCHYLVQSVKDSQYRSSLDRLCALRNFAAHDSKPSKKNALESVGQQKIGSSGSWLKRQGRFQEIVSNLRKLSEEVEKRAPY